MRTVLTTITRTTAAALLMSLTVGFAQARKEIAVISREAGSGTRGAFIELLGIETKSPDGTKRDMTTREAVIADKTDIMMTTVANDQDSIGYISLGSLNNRVKALEIGGVKASEANVKNGTYKIQRPFNIATKGEAKGLAKDFIAFIISREGQGVVTANKYVAASQNATQYSGNRPSGKIVVAGSSSVAPIMEKLREAYLTVNPNAAIEIQMNDSTAGLIAAKNGTCDIGMASRALKDSELADLTSTVIAMDGIAVIVNNKNPIKSLTPEQVKDVFTGKTTKWSAFK